MDIGSNIITKFKMKRQHFFLKPDYLTKALKYLTKLQHLYNDINLINPLYLAKKQIIFAISLKLLQD